MGNIASNEHVFETKEEMLRLAKEYYDAAIIVFEKCPNVAMNAMAYSIEVYLKLLILIESETLKKGHSIKELLDELEGATKIEIGEYFMKDPHSYQSVLSGWYDSPLDVVNKLAELYENEYAEQRYTYEFVEGTRIRKRVVLDFGSLVCFAESLDSVAQKSFPFSDNHTYGWIGQKH